MTSAGADEEMGVSHEPFNTVPLATVEPMLQCREERSRGRSTSLFIRNNSIPSNLNREGYVFHNEEHIQRDDRGAPLYVQYRRDVTADGVSLQTRFNQLTHIYNPAYFALKVAAIVTLPVCILSFTKSLSPHLQSVGPLIPVVATANTRLFCGEQIANSIQVMQGAFWILVWGCITSAIGVSHNEAAWWSLTFAAIVAIAFFPNLNSKRILMCYTLLILQMQQTEGGDRIMRSLDVSACFFLAAAFDILQCLLPFPKLNILQADRTFESAWKDVGKIAELLRKGVWSGRTVSGFVDTALLTCNELAATADGIPGMLFLSMYEPFERSLYNQLRNVRLTLLKRLLGLLYASCGAAQHVTSLTVLQMRGANEKWKDILRDAVDEYLAALQETLAALGTSLKPDVTVERCKFDKLQEKKDAVVVALHECIRSTCKTAPHGTHALPFYSFLHFHALLALLSEELHTFYERMENFNPKDYKSTWRRAWEFFFLDFYKDFTEELLDRVLLRTPASYRCLKDGIKMASAYCVAAALTMRMMADNTVDTFYFGMCIIVGISLPTAVDSIEVAVHRIAGMAFAMAVGYLARWKTHTYPQALALICCGTFIATCARSSTRYTHIGWYAGSVGPAAYILALDKAKMIVSVVNNAFAVMSYFMICTHMFALNSFRVLWNKRSIVQKDLADAITLLSATAQLPLDSSTLDIAEARISLALQLVKEAKCILPDMRSWANICGKEPIGVGKPFPMKDVRVMQELLNYTAASVEVWALGLQILHRARLRPAHPLICRMLTSIGSVLSDLDAASRAVFQDLIDSVQMSLYWSAELSMEHFSDFVMIKGRLDTLVKELHNDIIHAQRVEVRRASMGGNEAWNMNNRSFVSVAALNMIPDNVRAVADSGVPYGAKPNEIAQRERLRETAGDAPCNTKPPIDPNTVFPHTAFTSVLGSRPPPLTILSYRSPVGELPLDVDLTALTFVVMSAGTIINTLEKMIPHMNNANRFERSRRAAASCSVREFYMCPPQ